MYRLTHGGSLEDGGVLDCHFTPALDPRALRQGRRRPCDDLQAGSRQEELTL
jgi:hypothetical protein